MVAAYGGKCACCGEQNVAFLTIDHVNGDGKKDRAKTGYQLSGTILYGRLKAQGWPKEKYQLLCMNCNFAKSHNPGGCPHQQKKRGKVGKAGEVKVQ